GLIADPPVLALDEPSAALDPGQRERLWEFIGARAKRGTSVLFSTHIASEAQRYADRLIVLDAGELLFDGAPQAFMAEAGEHDGDIERALIAFLAARGRGARRGGDPTGRRYAAGIGARAGRTRTAVQRQRARAVARAVAAALRAGAGEPRVLRTDPAGGGQNDRSAAARRQPRRRRRALEP